MGCQCVPGSWGAGAAVSRGVREEVNRQFAVSLAAMGPSETCAKQPFTTWCREVCGLALSRATPRCRKGPMRAPGSHYSRKEGALFFLAPSMLLSL